MELQLPTILDIPPKLIPVITEFDNKRYFLLEGGRGGGKSQSIARFLIYLATKYKLRIVCGRETQNSISESVYSLFVDLIRNNQLDFEIQSQKIISRQTATEINFRGFREQGRFNIQGLEGIDIVWIDESQALKKDTLDVLIPTIRKDNAKIIFTMNRFLYNDPAFINFYKRDDCLHIHVDYFDNPFCTTALKKEADECKKLNMKDYNHIWLGEPLDASEDALFSLDEILRGKNNPHIMAKGYGHRVAGFDIARFGDDKSAVVILQQMGALHWEEIFVDEWEHRDLNYTTGRILSVTNEYKVDNAAIDADGLGAGPFDTLTRGQQLDYFHAFNNTVLSPQRNKSFGNIRTLNAYKLKDLFTKTHLCIKDRRLIDELMTIKYTFDNHQRRILVSKDKMKKDGFKSPNLADSLIMAGSLINEAKMKQERPYQSQQSAYSADDDIFKLAGIR